MSEEVKEILDNIDIWYKENDLDYSRWFGLEELKQLKDYITTLQYKYENQIHRYMNLKEQTTNLQEENERLKNQKQKAIEWIKEHIETYQKNEIVILDWDTFSDPRNLLKILGGDE